MQSIPGYPTDLDVAEPAALVTVNGVPYDVESLTVTRELSSNLPEQVTSASGYTAADGSVEWVVGEDVQERAAHPWDGNNFPPKPADSVVAYMGYGDVMVRQLTGAIDRSNGSVVQGSVSSDVVDAIDKLNQPVTFPTHLHVFPPHEDGGAFLPVGNEPTFTTDRILRACGFYATPPMDVGCILSVPLMGSAWPERGRVDSASQTGFPSFPPSFSTSHWGMAVTSIDARYTPDLSGFPTGRLDKTLQITMKVRDATASTGNTFVRAIWGTTHVTLMVTPAREIQSTIFDGTVWSTARISPAAALTADAFTVRYTPAGVLTIFANNGAASSINVAVPQAMATTNISSVWISAPHNTGVRIGGVQVGFSTAQTWNHPTTAILTPAAKSWSLAATPRIDARNALDVLKEQAEAECASMWIDEHGVFRWVNRDILTGSAPIATLTPLDVLDIGWESNADGVRSKVELTWSEPSVSRSDVTNKTVWQGPGGSLDPAQPDDIQLVEIPSDQEWIGVDESVSGVTKVPGWLAEFNRGRQSWWGGIEENDTDERWAHLSNPGFSTVMEKVGAFGYKFTTKAGTPTPGHTIELRTPGEAFSQSLRRSKAGFNLPVLRAKAIVEWSERKITGTILGPARAAALEHHVGPWVQDQTALQSLADWLAVQVSQPRPVLRDLSVIPDFRRQLGDVVWVEDPDNMRIRLKVLLTKISTTVSPGDAGQSIAGQILEVQSYGVTNAQLEAHAGKFTNAGFDTLWASATNAQLDADPLGRG